MLPLKGSFQCLGPYRRYLRSHWSSARAYHTSHYVGMENHDLYHYTSGAWVCNDTLRRAERYVQFNVEELKRVAAESINQKVQDVIDFQKIGEGGFNRVFEVTLKDTRRVIARIPYPITIPERLTVASEVATMDLVRSFHIPVPKVHGYSTTKTNPVGVEYILMEPVMGRNLGDLWFDMSEKERIKVVFEVVKLEEKLFSIGLPASGSVYYATDLPVSTERIALPNDQHKSTNFCIGPSTSLPFWFGKRSGLDVNRGPFSSSKELLCAGAYKELVYLQKYGQPRHPIQNFQRDTVGYQKQSPVHHCQHLHDYLKIADYLNPKDEILRRPTIRHPDLQPRNIFVSEAFEITALIDWQHAVVLPLFLCCGIPKDFQNYGDVVSESLIKPSLPPNFHELEPSVQAYELEVYRRRQLHFYYMAATFKENKVNYESMSWNFGVLRQKLFTHATEPWEGDNITLKADLVQVTQNWPSLLAETNGEQSISCPISYSEEEIQENLRLQSEVAKDNANMERLKDAIGVGFEGWVPLNLFEGAKARNEELYRQVIDDAEGDIEREQIKEHWPFQDHDEDEI